MSDGTATMEQVAAIVSRAETDPAFRNQLLTSTAATLQSEGISMPSGVSLQALEISGTTFSLVVPAMPANLSDDARQELSSLANSSATPDSALDAYAKLIIDAWQNSSLEQRLLSDPAAVLAERGISLPAGLSVKAVQATDSSSYVSLSPSASTTSTSASTQTLGEVASAVTANFGNLANLITAGSYLAGLAFSLSSIAKFKSHKDNPTQIPVGTPIALLFVGAALLFLPSILSTTVKTTT